MLCRDSLEPACRDGVTGAAIRPLVHFVGRELSRWQAGMAQYLQSSVRLA